jgi:hypothetical protein
MDLPIIWDTKFSGGLHIGIFCIANHAAYYKQFPPVRVACAEYKLLI